MAIQLDTPDAGASTSTSAGSKSLFEPLATLNAHSRSVTALRFSHDGSMLLSAGADGYVHFWDAASGAHRRSLRCHRTGINDISLSSDGLYFSTASDDGTALVFALDWVVRSVAVAPSHAASVPGANASALRTLVGHTAPVLSTAFCPRANMLATGSYDESAIIWDLRRGKALRTLPAHAEAIWSVGWDPEGALVVTGSADGLIRLWDVNTGQCLKTLDNDSNSPVTSAAFTPSSFYIMSSTLSSTIRIYSLNTGKVLKTLRAAEYVSERYPCPPSVFCGHDTAPETKVVNGHEAMQVDGVGESRAVSLAPKSKVAWVIAGSENGKVVIWDLQDRRVIGVLAGHSSPVVAVAVSPDGRTVATGALEPDRSIKLWRA